MTINVADVPQNAGRPNIPKQVCSFRIVGVEKRTSGAGNEMLAYELEFTYPESLKLPAGNTVKIAGMTTKGQITFHGKNDMPMQELRGLCAATRAPLQVELDNPAWLREQFLGKGIRAEIKTETKPLCQADDSGNLVPVLDWDNKPIIDNNYKVTRFVGADDRFTIPSSAVPY